MKEQAHLSRGGVDLVLAIVDGAIVIEHWGAPLYMLIEPPTWLTGVTLSGAVLMEIGLPAPILAPENALLIEINQSN
jgi:hypothetical protein